MGNRLGAKRKPNEAEIKTLTAIKETLRAPTPGEIQVNFRRLFKAVVPVPVTQYELPSKWWKFVGFQQEDPRSDIRGGGLLALKQLLYFSENFHTDAVSVINQQSQNTDIESTYPWAAAGINVTFQLCKLFDIQTGKFREMDREYWPIVSSESEFNDLYAFTFILLHQMWIETAGSSYMGFGIAMKNTMAALEALLSNGPSNMTDITTWGEITLKRSYPPESTSLLRRMSSAIHISPVASQRKPSGLGQLHVLIEDDDDRVASGRGRGRPLRRSTASRRLPSDIDSGSFPSDVLIVLSSDMSIDSSRYGLVSLNPDEVDLLVSAEENADAWRILPIEVRDEEVTRRNRLGNISTKSVALSKWLVTSPRHSAADDDSSSKSDVFVTKNLPPKPKLPSNRNMGLEHFPSMECLGENDGDEEEEAVLFFPSKFTIELPPPLSDDSRPASTAVINQDDGDEKLMNGFHATIPPSKDDANAMTHHQSYVIVSNDDPNSPSSSTALSSRSGPPTVPIRKPSANVEWKKAKAPAKTPAKTTTINTLRTQMAKNAVTVQASSPVAQPLSSSQAAATSLSISSSSSYDNTPGNRVSLLRQQFNKQDSSHQLATPEAYIRVQSVRMKPMSDPTTSPSAKPQLSPSVSLLTPRSAAKTGSVMSPTAADKSPSLLEASSSIKRSPTKLSPGRLARFAKTTTTTSSSSFKR